MAKRRRKTRKTPKKKEKAAMAEPMAGPEPVSEPMEAPAAGKPMNIGPLGGALIIALALVLVFTLLGQGPAEAPAEPEMVEEPMEEPPEAEMPRVEAEEPEPEEMPQEEPPEAAPEPEPEEISFLTGLRCVGDNVEGTITNALDTQLLVEDIRVLFNGNVIEPVLLRCDKIVVEPGESTFCESLQGVLPIEGENKVAVVIGEESATETIEC